MIKRIETNDENCVGCMECVAACSKRYFREDNPAKSAIVIQESVSGHFHIVVCDQKCGLCVAECPTQAIVVSKAGVVLINVKKCVGCLACVSVCPTGAMRWYPGNPIPFKCTACGSCVPVCPKQAIKLVTVGEEAAR